MDCHLHVALYPPPCIPSIIGLAWRGVSHPNNVDICRAYLPMAPWIGFGRCVLCVVCQATNTSINLGDKIGLDIDWDRESHRPLLMQNKNKRTCKAVVDAIPIVIHRLYAWRVAPHRTPSYVGQIIYVMPDQKHFPPMGTTYSLMAEESNIKHQSRTHHRQPHSTHTQECINRGARTYVCGVLCVWIRCRRMKYLCNLYYNVLAWKMRKIFKVKDTCLCRL